MTFSKSFIVGLLVLLGLVGESRATTLLASFEQGLTTSTFTDSVASGFKFEIGYESSTAGVFDGPVFASTTLNFPAVITTNSGAGFDALKLGIVDGIDDTILIAVTILKLTNGSSSPQTFNTTFLESAWISGGDTGLPGPDLTGFVLSDLVASNPFSFPSSGTSVNVQYGLNYKLFGTPQVSAVPLPAALPLFGTGLAVMGLIGWRRKRKVASTT